MPPFSRSPDSSTADLTRLGPLKDEQNTAEYLKELDKPSLERKEKIQQLEVVSKNLESGYLKSMFIKFCILLLTPVIFAGLWLSVGFGAFGSFGPILILLFILAVFLGFVFWNKSLKAKVENNNQVVNSSEVLQ